MVGLWVNNIKLSQEGLGNGGMGEWRSPPERVWWPPVLLIFYLIVTVSKTVYSILIDISFIIKAAQTNFV